MTKKENLIRKWAKGWVWGTQRGLGQEDHEFEASLGSSVTRCQEGGRVIGKGLK
jgi:hypothetical protein